ncbi:MAG: cob(I)yrinic acid a,c-diamide adenosyltransferase [Elusimicrobiota bacterium]
MKIYTKTGDRGSTGLIGGRRVAKTHPRIEACGAVDELNAFLGDALAVVPHNRVYKPLRRDLLDIQAELFTSGALLASPARRQAPDAAKTARLEARIDAMSADLTPLRNFIFPGGSPAGARLHICRAVCRRAERAVLRLGRGEAPHGVRVYLNRLSDYLFTAARWVNAKSRRAETRWKRRSD